MCTFFADVLLPKNTKPKLTREKLCEALSYNLVILSAQAFGPLRPTFNKARPQTLF